MTDTGDWRSRRWEETHQRIFETAIRLFQEQGFDRVNIGALGEAAAGVSVPTFYAHFPSKEHVVMQLPTPEEVAALLATSPRTCRSPSVSDARLRPGSRSGDAEERADMLARWKMIAATPALRTQAAAFERTTANIVGEGPPRRTGASLTPAEAVVVNAHLAAFTAGLHGLGGLRRSGGPGEARRRRVRCAAGRQLSQGQAGERSSTTVTSGRAPIRIGGPQYAAPRVT